MPKVTFTHAIQRHVPVPPQDVSARTVGEALARVFDGNAKARGYVLDDQGALRHHMAVFVDGAPIQDRVKLSDPVADGAEIYVMQSLSGG